MSTVQTKTAQVSYVNLSKAISMVVYLAFPLIFLLIFLIHGFLKKFRTTYYMLLLRHGGLDILLNLIYS